MANRETSAGGRAGVLTLILGTAVSGLASLAAQDRPNPQFTLSLLGPCGQTLEAPAGSAYDDGTGGGELFQNNRPGHTWDIALTTADNPGGGFEPGTRSWDFGLGFEGALSITDITHAGTVSCQAYNGPPCLARAGYELVELTGPPDGEGPQTEENRGAVSAVTLAFLGAPVWLPPEGTVVVAKIRVFAEFPPTEGQTAFGRVFFATRKGSLSNPVYPAVAWIGVGLPNSSVTATQGNPPLRLEDCEVFFKAVPPVARFIRCDSNDDGKSNLSDAVWIFNALFRGGPVTSCREAADCNADGLRDITDGVFAISFQLLGGSPPPAPFPSCARVPSVLPEDCPLGATRCP